MNLLILWAHLLPSVGSVWHPPSSSLCLPPCLSTFLVPLRRRVGGKTPSLLFRHPGGKAIWAHSMISQEKVMGFPSNSLFPSPRVGQKCLQKMTWEHERILCPYLSSIPLGLLPLSQFPEPMVPVRVMGDIDRGSSISSLMLQPDVRSRLKKWFKTFLFSVFKLFWSCNKHKSKNKGNIPSYSVIRQQHVEKERASEPWFNLGSASK